MFFLLTLISALIFRPLEAQSQSNTSICPKITAIDKVTGCFKAVRFAADHDERYLSEICCKAVRSIFPDCLLLVLPSKAVNTEVIKGICGKKFPGTDLGLAPSIL
ncbi:unnamed protein product [Microthlaspi erraticum]|uniref:Prolamin-like domain-containing protein n=1 Tax=Microthlaspi erraticum TaxID=1685480 RepID=A0A6D2JKW0_9BRAS|nr:unnamed protein product [Microthlaspi erraticum]CAA7041891.1 unnamed protein product [Microthlaspi erraticum]